MNMHDKVRMAFVISFAMLIYLSLAGYVSAGGYSDYYANKSSGSRSSNLTLKYGGTYGQAARNYMNYRYGYGTGRNNKYYSGRTTGPRYAPRRQQITPRQKREINRLMKQSQALINRIYSDGRIWK